MRTLARNPLLALLLVVVLAGGGAVVWNMYLGDSFANTSNAMSKPKHKRQPDKGRYVVLQMHWAPPAVENNISWNLGTSRGGSGTFKPGTLTTPWRRTSHAPIGAQITFGWAFIPLREPGKPSQVAERFKWELWMETATGGWTIIDGGNGPMTPTHKGPYIVR